MSEIRSGSNSDLTTGRFFDANCLNAFLEELGDEITGACMVPINLPQREIINIIKRAKIISHFIGLNVRSLKSTQLCNSCS